MFAERGGEFINNLHKTMLGYAGRFGLAREDVTKVPGEVFYFFGGHPVRESEVVDEFREFVAAMRVDLRRLSNEVTALSFTPADEVLDQMSLQAYLGGQNGAHAPASPIAKAAIAEAYVAEYGREPARRDHRERRRTNAAAPAPAKSSHSSAARLTRPIS